MDELVVEEPGEAGRGVAQGGAGQGHALTGGEVDRAGETGDASRS